MQLFFYWIDPEIALFIFLCHLESFKCQFNHETTRTRMYYLLYYALFLYLKRTMHKKVGIYKKEDLGNMSDKKKNMLWGPTLGIYTWLLFLKSDMRKFFLDKSYFLCTIFSNIMIWPWKKKRGSLQVYCHKIIWCASWNF